ncbi:MAG: asparagine synthase-related protein [Sphingomonas sp.]|jgi:asparagine synthase (glutamine-hydrolysing)|uniref:asparagine synthase-related protein n=1 Tax=Sphingomonas sp. TaxID=28214 RepID=UPI003566C80A
MKPLRYLLVVFRDLSDSRALTDRFVHMSGLVVSASGPQFALLTPDGSDVISFPDGAVAGKLFHRFGHAHQIREIDEHEGLAIQRSGGAKLIEKYWGAYVAIIPNSNGIMVLRDPSGGMPCYTIRTATFTAFCSDPAILMAAGLLTPSINWQAFARHLYLPDLPFAATALDGVSQVMPGSASLESSEGYRIITLWSPWDHVTPHSPLHSKSDPPQLERTIQSCTSAWASCFNGILLGVSGGLDSSILAHCFAATKAELTCITLSADDPSGDEREYARVMCRAVGAELIEAPYLLKNIDIDCSVGAHLPRPGGRSQALAYDRQVLDAVNRHSIDAFCTGNGGDNVFFLSHSARAIVDRFRVEGLGWNLVQTVRDICTLTGCSIPQAVREAIRIARLPGCNYRWPINSTFLEPDVVPAGIEHEIHHPWLDAPAKALPGKAAHIAMLLRMHNHLEGFDREIGPAVLNPLTSQPIVELCLGIPSWEACAGGRDRAVAREAFGKRLPPVIVHRRTKGGPDGFAAQILGHFRDAIRDRLMDGILSAQGIVDRAAIARALTPSMGDYGNSYVRLLLLADAEAWARHWTGASKLTDPIQDVHSAG